MATRGAQTYLTPKEYITLERKAVPDAETVRSEYINGEIINMPGASFPHNLITNTISKGTFLINENQFVGARSPRPSKPAETS